MVQTGFEKSLIGKLKNEGIFDEFYVEFLLCFEKKMDHVFKNTSLKLKNDENIKIQLLLFLKNKLCAMGIRTLIFEIHKFQESSDFSHASKKQIYVDFCRKLMQGFTEKILDEYTMLGFLMKYKEKATANFLYELLKNLESDKYLLEQKFHIDISIISSIDLSEGNTYNHGKMVAIITFASGHKVVYKPRNLKAEWVYGQICEWMNVCMPQKRLLYAAVIDQGNYGWQEYIERKECKTEDEVHTYFYKMGKNMALFFLLNTTDLHSEDIFPCGEDPYFVDLQTLSAAPKKRNQDNEKSNLALAVEEQLENSVFKTLLLPNVFGNGILDASGFGARLGQKSKTVKCFELVNKGNADIHFEMKTFIRCEMPNSVILNGRKISFISFVNEIEQGFQDVCYLCLKEKQTMERILHSVMKQGHYRQILRDSFTYNELLEASLNPVHLKQKSEFRQVLKLFHNQYSGQIKFEMLQMMHHDIPYFASDYDSADLYAMEKIAVKDFFQKSLKENLQESVDSLDNLKIKQQVAYIRNAAMLSKEDIMIPQKMTADKETLECLSDKPLAVLAAIRKKIEQAAIWNKQHTECTFIDVWLGEKAYLGVIHDDLYYGLGLVWFLYAYADYTKDQEDWAFAEAVRRGMESRNVNEKLSIGIFSGYFSRLYLYANLYQLTKNSEFATKCKEIWEKSAEYDPFCESSFDIVGGIAGTVLFLAHMFEQYPTKQCSMRLERYAGILAEKCSREKNLCTGFAKGMTGLATALQLAGKALKRTSWIQIARKLEQKEDQFYSEQMLNWQSLRKNEERYEMFWCHGAPGILLGRSYYVEEKEFSRRYENVIKQVVRETQEKSMSESLCNGMAGNMDILLTIANNQNCQQLYGDVQIILKKLLKKLRYEGASYEITQMKGVVSFMTGLSGIGYGILRNLNSKLPCVLALELYGGNKYKM